MRDGLPASYDSWRLASPPEEPYTWDCNICGAMDNAEDARCSKCRHYEDDDIHECWNCEVFTWDGEPCYNCDAPEEEPDED